MFILNTKTSKTFKVLSKFVDEPVTQYIPTDSVQRDHLYKEYEDEGVILPKYSDINSVGMDKLDLVVLEEDWSIDIGYIGKIIRITARKGFIYDMASTPVYLQFGRMSKNSQYCAMPALVHDMLYSLNIMPKDNCDDIFEGLLSFKKTPYFYKLAYIAGVRLFGSNSYMESHNKRSWMTNFVSFELISK